MLERPARTSYCTLAAFGSLPHTWITLSRLIWRDSHTGVSAMLRSLRSRPIGRRVGGRLVPRVLVAALLVSTSFWTTACDDDTADPGQILSSLNLNLSDVLIEPEIRYGLELLAPLDLL